MQCSLNSVVEIQEVRAPARLSRLTDFAALDYVPAAFWLRRTRLSDLRKPQEFFTMTRTVFAVVILGALAAVASPGCKDAGVGDPCTPEQEYNPDFAGFSDQQVNVESRSFQCQTRVCLVNHFRGRVSCPYGQGKDGAPPTGAQTACTVPGDNSQNIVPDDPKNAKQVQPQCTDRQADKAVYCSCRCANKDGRTDDGSNYCTCPDGFACEQLVSSIGTGNEGLTGAYCIKAGTKYNGTCGDDCDATTGNCGTTQLGK